MKHSINEIAELVNDLSKLPANAANRILDDIGVFCVPPVGDYFSARIAEENAGAQMSDAEPIE